MVRLILAFLLALAPTLVSAKQIVVYTRFPVTSGPGHFAVEIVNQLNLVQNEYEFKLSVLPGSNGEAADQRALTAARAGEDLLVIGTTSNFSFNRYLVGNTYDRDNDFVPLQVISSLPVSIMVSKTSGINSVDDLIKHLNTKPKAFEATTIQSVSAVLMDIVFRNSMNIKNVTQISYGKAVDIGPNVIRGEADYTVMGHTEVFELKRIATSGDQRDADIPTGKELGIKDFEFTGMNMFFIPKERIEFGNKIKPMLNKVCKSDEIQKVLKSREYTPECNGDVEFVKTKIKKELELIEKYKDQLILK